MRGITILGRKIINGGMRDRGDKENCEREQGKSGIVNESYTKDGEQ